MYAAVQNLPKCQHPDTGFHGTAKKNSAKKEIDPKAILSRIAFSLDNILSVSVFVFLKILSSFFSIPFAFESQTTRHEPNLIYEKKAILNRLGKIDDPIAFELLPKKSRWVANVAAKFLPNSVIEKLGWIVQRTEFIDGQLKLFLEETGDESESANPKRQVLVLGSGYDTRCLRYGNLPGVGFYCVDLPSVASNCGKIVERYRADVGESSGNGIPEAPTFVSLDLNSVGSDDGKVSLLETLSNAGFATDGSIPTMVLCEAVLFYLTPSSAQSITSELFSLRQSRYCLTDNLSKVGVIPGGGPEGPPPIAAKARCEKWLSSQNKDLVDHDSIWGGAIHFVGARESSA